MRSSWLSLIPGHVYVVGDSHRNAFTEWNPFRFVELQSGDGTGELFKRNLGLELGEHVAQAVVNTEAKGQVFSGVRAGDIEGFTVFEAFFIAVCRAHQQQDLSALWDRDATNFGVLECFTTPGDDRARVA